jgi:glycosyltransferase involved in cell wall biosynthesis
MKVCFVTNASAIGGAERVLLETISQLTERGVQCCVLAGGDGDLVRALRSADVPCAFHHVGSWVTWQKPTIWTRVKCFCKIMLGVLLAAFYITRWKCDVVYSNSITACHGALVAKLLHIPHIWHLHEFGKEDHGVFYAFGERFTNRTIGSLSGACIAVSNALAAKYRRYILPSKIVVIYPSMTLPMIDTSQTDDIDPFRLLIIGGVGEGKGQADAVQALAQLVKEGMDVELSLVGEPFPVYRRYLEQLIDSNGLEKRVRFVGRVQDPRPYLQAADVVLVCSRSEAFGRATIEGMLAGKAVVGARAGATAELIQDGVNGLLYNCREPLDLASKIRFLYDNPEFVKRVSRNAREWATSSFTRERNTDAVAALLESVSDLGIIPPNEAQSLTKHGVGGGR